MSKTRFLLATLAMSAFAAAPDGEAIYKARCAGCHDGQPQPRMPERAQLTTRTPEFVLSVLANGVMTMQAAGLSDDEERAVARYITGKEFSAASTAPMAGQCTTPAPPLKMLAGDWTGWGGDPNNAQPDQQLEPNWPSEHGDLLVEQCAGEIGTRIEPFRRGTL